MIGSVTLRDCCTFGCHFDLQSTPLVVRIAISSFIYLVPPWGYGLRNQVQLAIVVSNQQDANASRKILLMVGEFHLRGFQRLRILPYMAPSGTSWRCTIGPAGLFSEDGLELNESGEFGVTTVTYTSASVTEYFNWTNAQYETPSGLARLFIERFPQIVTAAKGSDWTYVGWYIEMLGLTYSNHFPYAFADWDGPEERKNNPSSWRTITIGESNGVKVRVPVPLPNL